MADKISQLTEVATLTGEEDVPVASGGHTLRFKLKNVAELITKDTVGLGAVDNTADIDKPVSRETQSKLNEKAPLNHSHAIGNVTGLTNALSEKAEAVHDHEISEVDGLGLALAGKAPTNHQHALADVAGLTDELGKKSAVGHTHAITEVAGLADELLSLEGEVSGKAEALHTHSYIDVTGLKAYIEEVSASAGAGDVTVNNLEW